MAVVLTTAATLQTTYVVSLFVLQRVKLYRKRKIEIRGESLKYGSVLSTEDFKGVKPRMFVC
jgi:hypothetical protein